MGVTSGWLLVVRWIMGLPRGHSQLHVFLVLEMGFILRYIYENT